MERYLYALLIIFLCWLPSEAMAANRFAVCTTTCTWDGASTAMWSATTGGATGASVPGSADAVILDAATCVGGTTCTVTVNTTVNVLSITNGACTASTTGCILDFSVNNNNVTATLVSGTGIGTRNLKMGNGTWTITGTSGTVWNFVNGTGQTFTANSSVLVFSASTVSTRTFSSTSLTYATLSITANSTGGSFVFSGTGNVITTSTITGPVRVEFPGSQNITITNPFTWTGTSGNEVSVSTTTDVNQATITTVSGTAVCTWCAVREMTFTGGATFIATNSFDLGRNSGITITAPAGGAGGCILGGWLLWRDFDFEHMNDNFPAWLEKAG